jgi:hypothetical protein
MVQDFGLTDVAGTKSRKYKILYRETAPSILDAFVDAA